MAGIESHGYGGCCSTVLLARVLVCGWSGVVWAQLTAEDVEALKKQGAREGWTFTVAENEDTRYSLDKLCGFFKPEGWEKLACWDPCTPRRGLPGAFDWRDFGGCGSDYL